MTLTTAAILYAFTCVLAFSNLVWDTTKCRPFRIRDIPIHALFAVLWPGVIVLFFVVWAGICIVDRLEGVGDKVLVPSRKKR